MNRASACLFSGCIIAMLAPAQIAARPIDLGSGAPFYDVGLFAEYFIDSNSSFDVDILQQAEAGVEFLPLLQKIPNLGFQNSPIWLRLQVHNPDESEQRLLLEAMPTLELIHVIDPAEGELGRAGRGVPAKDFIYQHRNHVFPIEFPGNSSRVIYLRIESRGPIILELRLWRPTAHRERDYVEQLFFGAFFGITSVVVLYNLFFFLAVRERAYFYYVCHVAVIGLVFASAHGFGRQYFWPDSPIWNVRSMPALAEGGVLFGLLFTRSFLRMPQTLPRLDILIRPTIAASALIIALSFFGEWPFLWIGLLFLNIAALPIIFSAGVLSLWRGNHAARFFVAGWGCWILTLVLESFMVGGLLPFDRFHFSYLQLPSGSVIEMLLLSMALADRYRILRVEKEQAGRSALRSRLFFHRAAARARRFERELLKKTIQPHFLMNSLAAVQGWLRSNPRRADRLIQALAREMRLILDSSRKKRISLKSEIELCRAHLVVMSFRLGQRYRLRVRGVDESDEFPPLIFHTMIENAFTHMQGADARLDFILEKEKQSEEIQYRFDTIGSSVQANSAGVVRSREGTGMRYVRARLEELYPGRWRMTYGAIENGFRVTIGIVPPGIS